MATSRVEVITSVERRRRFTESEKLRFVAETQTEGASVASVAKKHGMSEGLLFAWRRAVRDGKLGPGAALARTQDAAPACSPFIRVHASAPETTSIRVSFPNGVAVELPASTEPQWIAALVRAIGVMR